MIQIFERLPLAGVDAAAGNIQFLMCRAVRGSGLIVANSPLCASFANAKTVFQRQGKSSVTRSFTSMYGMSRGMLNLFFVKKRLLPAKMHWYMRILIKILF